MTLIPWKNKAQESDPTAPSLMRDLRQEMDRLFDTFLREPFGALSESIGSLGMWYPAVDVVESEQEVIVRAELPGVDPNDLDLTVSGNRLTLAGEKKETLEKKPGEYYHRESRFGRFARTVPLPAEVDPDRVQAEFAHGVLTVHVPKSSQAAAKKVPIKSP